MSTAADVLQEDLTLLAPPEAAQVLVQQDATSWQYPLLVCAAALLLAACVWFWWRRRTKRMTAEAADRIALQELAKWEQLTDPAQFREAVSEVSATVRHYTAARFGLQAPTLTTEEFWMRHASGKIPPAYTPFWTDFLSASDAIKYAGLTPEREQFSNLVLSAVDFVRSSCRGART